MPRGMRKVCAIATVLAAIAFPRVLSADTGAALHVRVQVSARTSLRVSSETLTFTVTDPDTPATAAVEFTASARVAPGSRVVLTVEPLGVPGLTGPVDADARITFTGDGNGTRTGELTSSGAAIGARWQGSGVHEGRLTFSLRASAPGVYHVPVQLLLTTP
jgi:hypothetical protein